jgi:hypothetical protein
VPELHSHTAREGEGERNNVFIFHFPSSKSTQIILPFVSEVINERIDKHLNKLESHPNPLVETLTQPVRNKRLKRRTSDLHDLGDIAGWSPYQDNIIRIAN